MSFYKSCFEQKVTKVKTIDQAHEFNRKEDEKLESDKPKIRKIREKIKELERKVDMLNDTYYKKLKYERRYYIPSTVGKLQVDNIITRIEKVGRNSDNNEWVYFIDGNWYDIQQGWVNPFDNSTLSLTLTDIKTGMQHYKIP